MVRLLLLALFLFFFPCTYSTDIVFKIEYESDCMTTSCSLSNNTLFSSPIPPNCSDCTLIFETTSFIIITIAAEEENLFQNVIIRGALFIVKGVLQVVEDIFLCNYSTMSVKDARYTI